MPAKPPLGSKVFYKIGEVSDITKLPAYVLRFWESEFNFLKPRKSRGNQRLYVRRDIEQVLEIKRMLYEEGYTIPGLKRFWVRRNRHVSKGIKPQVLAERVRGELHAILKIMKSFSAGMSPSWLSLSSQGLYPTVSSSVSKPSERIYLIIQARS